MALTAERLRPIRFHVSAASADNQNLYCCNMEILRALVPERTASKGLFQQKDPGRAVAGDSDGPTLPCGIADR